MKKMDKLSFQTLIPGHPGYFCSVSKINSHQFQYFHVIITVGITK